MEFDITNASVDMIELGWQQIQVTHEGKTYEIELESRETPMSSNRDNIIVFEYADDGSAAIGDKIGLDLKDEETIEELRSQWDNYSNENFRG